MKQGNSDTLGCHFVEADGPHLSPHSDFIAPASPHPGQLPIKQVHILWTVVRRMVGIVVIQQSMYPLKKQMAKVVETMSLDRGTTYPDPSPLMVVHIIRFVPMIG